MVRAMSDSKIRFDDGTVVQPTELPALSRRKPHLLWTDAAGPHDVMIERRTVIGSGEAAEIAIADPAVSRVHGEIDARDDGLWIRDLSSRNGTYVEGVRVGLARVPDGGRIRIGSTEIRVQHERVAAPVDLWPDDHFGALFGRSSVMRELFARIARVSATNATVLIQGETGSGKELVARAIHDASPRRAGPFVVVDCGALPEALLESELFGHAKGAFTGAVSARAGAVESAHGGTVFLDEVGELPLGMQPKLLRAIEAKSVRRVGESAYRNVDVRFVTATHRDLATMVNEGAFREDLYFRLAVVPIGVPPLRERRDDVPLLIQHFVPAGASVPLDADVLRELTSRPWLGNVRELRNFVDRAMALGAREALDATPAGRTPRAPANDGGFPPITLDRPFKSLREEVLDHLERVYLRGLLARHDGKVTAVAHAAGLDPSYIHRLVKKHDL
jgi:transcriptional regulator with GAF, ATPase, and Fis domain